MPDSACWSARWAMGYRFQFITLAGFHALNASMFDLAHAYAGEGMSAYVRLQEREIELESLGLHTIFSVCAMQGRLRSA